MLAASAKLVGEQWRLAKPEGKKLPIDSAVALAMGLEVLARPAPEEVWVEVIAG